jgi:putative polyketide hydroxylase
MPKIDVPVLVVGAGPVGLMTGMFLSHWGIAPLVIERRTAISELPRAAISLRTQEVLRSVGLGHALERAGWEGGPPMLSTFKDSGFGTTLHRAGLPQRYARRLETCSPADPRLVLTQDRLQHLALAVLRDRGCQVRFGAQVVALEREPDRVRARVVDTDTGALSELTARYVIAADGANSDIRQHLGITMSDREVVSRLNTAFFRANLAGALNDWGTHTCFVRNDDVYATLISKDGRDRWSSHIMEYPGKPDELTELSEAKAIELLRPAIGDSTIPIELDAVNAWEAAIGMASAFRQGRVFLVGDAAHVQSSAGGLGMNTGIQDGHNLAWKVAAVLRGQFGPTLLDSYEPERRAAVEASLALSRGLHRGYMSLQGDASQLYENIAADYPRAMMFYSYSTSSGSERDLLDDEIAVGRRFPHHRVEPDQASTLDLIGSRWTLFAGSDLGPWRAFADTVPIDLQVHQLEVLGDAALVRPDGFVAWRGAAVSSCRAALQDLGLARAWSQNHYAGRRV